MKKVIIFFLVLFICFNAISQSVIQRTPGTNTVNDPRQMHTLNLFIPRYLDTVNANQSGSIGIDSCGAEMYTYTGDVVWIRGCSPKRWIAIGTGIPSSTGDTLFAQLPLFFDSLTRAPSTIIKFLQGNGIVSGGTITVDSCRTIDVLPTVIVLNYVQYSSPATVLTVPVSDPTFPRTDEIIDSLGYIILRVGTPSATPIGKPYNSSTEVVLGSYTIQAGASCIDINQIIVWDQNVGTTVEFNFTTFGTINANGDNTDQPKHLTKAIFVSTYTNGSSLIFTYSSPLTAQAGEIFKFWVYLNGTFGTNQFQIQYFLGSTPVGSPISFGSGFGFNPNDSNFYQQVNVPLSANNLINQTFDKIVITFSGEDISGAKGLYLDYLQLQTGATNTGTQLILTTIGSSGAATYNPVTNILNIPIYSGGGGGSQATIYTADSLLSSDRTVGLNGHSLTFQDAGGTTLSLAPALGEFGFTTPLSKLILLSDDADEALMRYDVDNQIKINGTGIAFTADSIFNNSTLSGASAGYVWTLADPTTGSGYWGVSGSGGNQNLQQVTDIGFTTTNPMESTKYIVVNTDGTFPGAMGVNDPTHFSTIVFNNEFTTGIMSLGYTNPNGGGGYLYADSVAASTIRLWHLPDTSGTLVAMVNGLHPDSHGNVNVSSGASFTDFKERFTGSTSTSITLSHTPLNGIAVEVYDNGVLQDTPQYSLTGTALTLNFTPIASDVITLKYLY